MLHVENNNNSLVCTLMQNGVSFTTMKLIIFL